jgi:ribosomal protein S18 acetylase RimI-like enzyme
VVSHQAVELQPATPEFAPVVPDLIRRTDPDLFDCIVGGRREVLTRWLSGLFSRPGNSFSFEFATAAVCEGCMLGLEIGYPGAERARLGSVSARQAKALVDEESLARMRTAFSGGTGYLTPFVPDHAYYLMILSVEGSQQNRGIGRRLLENAFRRAQDAGLTSVHLDVYAGNPAIRLYERVGMEVLVETHVPRLELDHGIPPHYRMVLDLRDDPDSPHRPRNSGSRFSRKAATPSR